MYEFSTGLNGGLKFRVQRDNFSERCGLDISVYLSNGGVACLSVNEADINYRLLAQFFNTMADQLGEPSFEECLVAPSSEIRNMANDIANLPTV